MKKYALIILLVILIVGFKKNDGVNKEKHFFFSRQLREEINKVTTEYLENNFLLSSNDDKVFCSYKELGGQKKSDSVMDYYIYSLCVEYNHKLEEGSGISAPMVLTIDIKNHAVKNLRKPRDGSYYVKDLRKLFPNEVDIELTEDQRRYLKKKHFQKQNNIIIVNKAIMMDAIVFWKEIMEFI
jgi:hypothetical protein